VTWAIRGFSRRVNRQSPVDKGTKKSVLSAESRQSSVHCFPLRHGSRALDTNRLANRSKESIVYAYEDAAIDERLETLGKVVDRGERARLLREIGDQKFFEFADIPIYWLFAEATVNPKYIAEYVFPGIITGFFTHLEYIKLAP
jgi:hypothetical protein